MPDPNVITNELPTLVAKLATDLQVADVRAGRHIQPPYRYARQAYDLALAAAAITMPNMVDALPTLTTGVHIP